MNHPYLYPDDCPWLQDYHDLRILRTGRSLPLLSDDEIDLDQDDQDFDDFQD